MKEVTKLQIKDRTELFQATAISMGMQPNVIEKDFWVCFMLDHLFHDYRYKNAFVFKGGTSLSKSYHVIERFSEDIDLILDWRKIINDEVNPWEERSKTKQDLFNKQINSEAAKFYKEELIPQLNSEMKEKLGDGEWISVDTEDEMVVNFYYPQIFEAEYLRSCVRLEIGPFYYRIRQGDFRIKAGEDSKEKKMQLFHIKKTLRNRVGAYRYSVAGSPCLYLASDRELAWFECGMPKQFSYCQMLIDEDNDNRLVLVDFSFRPVDVLSSITCWLLNARRQDKKDVDVYYKFLLRYIMIYPIAAACSVKVKDRNTKFVEEYVFPQLFMQWIRETDEFDGVRYKSSLNTNLVDGMGAII